ncbi:hypothetical protein [Gordonia soli]|nr:hypothetical protein [Gordonia soli]
MTATILSVLLHTWGAIVAARQNFGYRLPAISGGYPVRPAQRVKRAQTAGWLLSIVGVLGIGGAVWDTAPWWGLATAAVLFLLVNVVPSLAVTALHNRRELARG